MKILHTSDLHLGKGLNDASFYENQKKMLNDLLNIIKQEHIDVVMIPGDLYDKSIPSTEANKLLGDFLGELSDLETEVLITSGNHDSRERLSFASYALNKLNIHIVTNYEGSITKFEKDGVVFYMLPFIKPFYLKGIATEDEYEYLKTTNEAIKWILSREEIDKSKKNILMAHQFVMNAGVLPEMCDSESISENSIGTTDAIDYKLLDDFDYVALGHIHRPQKVGRDTIRYSGTPLKYSFSEVNDNKTVVIINTDDMSFELKPIEPLRQMRVITGLFDDVINMEPSNDIIKVILTDEEDRLSPMVEIQKRFPNALSLAYANRLKSVDEISYSIEDAKEKTPKELFEEFFEIQNDRPLNENESKIFENILSSLGGEE